MSLLQFKLKTIASTCSNYIKTLIFSPISKWLKKWKNHSPVAILGADLRKCKTYYWIQRYVWPLSCNWRQNLTKVQQGFQHQLALDRNHNFVSVFNGNSCQFCDFHHSCIIYRTASGYQPKAGCEEICEEKIIKMAPWTCFKCHFLYLCIFIFWYLLNLLFVRHGGFFRSRL